MIALKHEGRLQEATEGDRPLRAMGLLVVDVVPHIDRPHHQEEGRRLEGMEDDQIQGIVTWILTGRAHILGRGHDRVHTRLGRGAVLRHGEVKGIDDGIVRRRQEEEEEEEEEEGGEGEVRAILAFRATVIEVVAGVGVGIEGDGLGRGLNYALQTLKRESTDMSLGLNEIPLEWYLH